ncbi:MAG: ABC transporter permease subunit [Oscillospiraceae bacterium]
MLKLLKKCQDLIISLLLGALILFLWQAGKIHELLSLKPYQLPLPDEILKTFRENADVIRDNTFWTLREALLGILIGSLIGFAVAVFAAAFPKIGIGGISIVTAVNAIPMIAMASIMNNWFGMATASKAAVVAVFSMAAMALNAFRGMTDLPEFSRELMQICAARRMTVFFKLQLPNSIPYVLTALKISTTTGLMAAICSEFFTSYKGIGYKLTSSIKLSQMSMAWSYILVATLCGVLMYAVLSVVERVLLKWHASQR